MKIGETPETKDREEGSLWGGRWQIEARENLREKTQLSASYCLGAAEIRKDMSGHYQECSLPRRCVRASADPEELWTE